MLETPGVDNMVLALSNLSQFFTFFPLPVTQWWVLIHPAVTWVGWYTPARRGWDAEVLSSRSLWIGCCRPIVTKIAPLWPTCCSSVALLLRLCCRPLYCGAPRICCRDGEVLSRGLLWETAQAWLRVISSFLQQSHWIWLIGSWPLLAQSCYLPNIGWVLAGK